MSGGRFFTLPLRGIFKRRGREAPFSRHDFEGIAMEKSPSRTDFRFFWPSRVRYSEIDGQAVAYNAHYLTWFDTAIFEYYRAIGYDQFHESKVLGEDWHVVRALVEYKAPLTYDVEFEVGVQIAKIGNSSLTYSLAIFPKEDKTLLAAGEIVQVYTDQKTHKSIPIPERVRSLYSAFEPELRG
jgi:acyl-CoA thioester hydrolase